MKPCKALTLEGKWVVGWYLKLHCLKDGAEYYKHIIDGGYQEEDRWQVIPETVCRPTGRDNLYEGDVFECFADGSPYTVTWNDSKGRWEFVPHDRYYRTLLFDAPLHELKIIGNIRVAKYKQPEDEIRYGEQGPLGGRIELAEYEVECHGNCGKCENFSCSHNRPTRLTYAKCLAEIDRLKAELEEVKAMKRAKGE